MKHNADLLCLMPLVEQVKDLAQVLAKGLQDYEGPEESLAIVLKEKAGELFEQYMKSAGLE